MQTHIADFIRNTPQGQTADQILRSCVHCGFCNATCPTYQLLGDELDGPRGRIYLIKQMLEGESPTRHTQQHLDRCLTCRNCETTCPSGVAYGRLLDIGRELVDIKVPRDIWSSLQRWGLRQVLPYTRRFGALLSLGRLFRPLLTPGLKRVIPAHEGNQNWPAPRHTRKMLVLDGCVQPSLAPHINATAARLLDRLGISLIRAPQAGCCGAMSFHTGAQASGLDFMRRNIDAWLPFAEQCEAIVMTASGCGVMVKDYGELLKDDADYADKAARISSMTKDLCEVLADEDLSQLKPVEKKAAFHAPCTLQHGQQLNGHVEKILQQCGITLTSVSDSHLCCGSAGTYSILQPTLSRQLLDNKIKALESEQPACIATANIGCWSHLRTAAGVPVKHWVELLEPVHENG